MPFPSLDALLDRALCPPGRPHRLGLARAAAFQPDPARRALRRETLARHPERLAASDGAATREAGTALGALHYEDVARDVEDDTFVVERATQRVVGHAIAHPSGYAPEALLGRTVGEAHGPVPELDPLTPAIARFLDALGPGEAYDRVHLGFAPRGQLDRHPSRATAIGGDPDAVDLRFELQRFEGLASGVLFRVRPLHLPMPRPGTSAYARIVDALAALSPALARYRGVEALRATLLAKHHA